MQILSVGAEQINSAGTLIDLALLLLASGASLLAVEWKAGRLGEKSVRRIIKIFYPSLCAVS